METWPANGLIKTYDSEGELQLLIHRTDSSYEVLNDGVEPQGLNS